MIEQFKNPLDNQYVAPFGYHFERCGKSYGRIIWLDRASNEYTLKKDEF